MDRPQFYYRDGKPILADEMMGATLKWALLFENEPRTVHKTLTPYGESLSTVFLGLDHNFSHQGPPLIFETMLFAPRKANPKIRGEWEAEDKTIRTLFPHDQLQIRYSHEDEAKERHEALMLQCLFPPRWRRFLFYTIGQDDTWS